MSETGLQGSHIAIIDPQSGKATRAFWRLIEELWRRTGGFSDILEDLSEADAGTVALINSLEAQTLEYGEGITRLDQLTAGAGDPDQALEVFEALSDRLNSAVPAQDENDFAESIEALFRLNAGNRPDDEDYSISISDEGNLLTNRVTSINFVGSGVEATTVGSEVTVTITGGTGGGGSVSSVFGRTGAVVAATSDYDADQVDFDPSTTDLTSSDVQGAIVEVADAAGYILATGTPDTTGGYIDLTSLDFSSYSRIRIYITEIVCDTDDDEIAIQLYNNGTLQTANYFYHIDIKQSNSTATVKNASETGDSIILCSTDANRGIGNASTESGGWVVEILSYKNPFWPVLAFMGSYINSGAHMYSVNGGGSPAAAFNPLDGIRIIARSGNITAGRAVVTAFE